MMTNGARRYVVTKLSWLVVNPPRAVAIATTAYRQEEDEKDLFSVVVYFSSRDAAAEHWQEATVFCLAAEMEDRLPAIGSRIVITAGLRPIAEAEVIAEGIAAPPPFRAQ